MIVRGKAIGNMRADITHDHKPKLLDEVCESFEKLKQDVDFIFIEGAGSPAEIKGISNN